MSEYQTVILEQRGAVTLVMLNRPQALNALNSEVLRELIDVFAAYDADEGQRCLVLTGSGDRAFAAGADIKEMQPQGFADMYSSDFFAGWEKVTATRKPWIAAVNGFALGGGCEIAMMADFIIAADTAKFGQPEIKLGVTPGMGGSQRLTWAVGKAKAMEMCLTGRMMDAEEAERSGLVAKVVPAAQLLERSDENCRNDRGDAASRRDRGQGNGQCGVRNAAWHRASASSGGCSMACSGPRTRRKAWPPSSRSGRGIGRDAEHGAYRIHRAWAHGRRNGAEPRQCGT